MNATNEKTGTCGCGRKIPATIVARAVALSKKVVCSTCGATGEPKKIRLEFEGYNVCQVCGDEDNHDGEDCPMERN